MGVMANLRDVEAMERRAMLALLLRPNAHWSEVADEVEQRGSVLTVLRAPALEQGSLFDVEDSVEDELQHADRLLQEWASEGMVFRMILDQDYPKQLLTIRERPPFVTWMGNASDSDASGVAIVGTRKASDEGTRTAGKLAREFADRGITVISGLAAGIDTAAHRGALEAGGRTVAVIGTGLRRSYPAQNEALQREIAASGMVLSQFLPDASPTRISFPMRNAVMSGLASATVVIEADEKSGAKMQARLALQHGRRVFLMTSLARHEWAQKLGQRPGARFVSSVDEIVRSLGDSEVGSRELVDR
jgi:DNA processing protein